VFLSPSLPKYTEQKSVNLLDLDNFVVDPPAFGNEDHLAVGNAEEQSLAFTLDRELAFNFRFDDPTQEIDVASGFPSLTEERHVRMNKSKRAL
jgi:hypothetical protein